MEEIGLDGYLLVLRSAGKEENLTYIATIFDEIGAFSVAMNADKHRAIGLAVAAIPAGIERRQQEAKEEKVS